MRKVAYLALAVCLSVLALAGPAGADGGSGTSDPSGTTTLQEFYVPAFSIDLPTGSTQIPSASPSGSSQNWVCSIFASNPHHVFVNNRESIRGHGFQSCTGATYYQTALKVTIQKYKGLGFWNNLYSWSSNYTDNPYLERVIWWYCTADNGTQTYRIVTDGWQGTYHAAVQSEQYLRVTCP